MLERDDGSVQVAYKTAHALMKRLGADRRWYKGIFYTDIHEKPEVIEYRKKYLERVTELELRVEPWHIVPVEEFQKIRSPRRTCVLERARAGAVVRRQWQRDAELDRTVAAALALLVLREPVRGVVAADAIFPHAPLQNKSLVGGGGVVRVGIANAEGGVPPPGVAANGLGGVPRQRPVIIGPLRSVFEGVTHKSVLGK